MLGNAAFASLLNGLKKSSYAWSCFRENCRRLDPRKNHILFRALQNAHWKAVAQVLAEYSRAQGPTLFRFPSHCRMRLRRHSMR